MDGEKVKWGRQRQRGAGQGVKVKLNFRFRYGEQRARLDQTSIQDSERSELSRRALRNGGNHITAQCNGQMSIGFRHLGTGGKSKASSLVAFHASVSGISLDSELLRPKDMDPTGIGSDEGKVENRESEERKIK